MKKFVWFAGGVLAALLVVGVFGAVFAQAPTPGQPVAPGFGMMGQGMMGRGQHGPMMQQGGEYGVMHTDMVAALAEKLGMPEDEINSRLENGETMLQIAQSKGLSDEAVTQLFSDARKAALENAVKAGTITQEQADWMLSRMSGSGNMPGCGAGRMGGGRGAGARWQQQPSS